MTPTISKVIFVALVIGWYSIRYEYARRSRREKIVWSARGPAETALLLISLAGLGLVPLVYVATMWMPWLLTAQTMMLPAGQPRTLPSAVHPEQEAPAARG